MLCLAIAVSKKRWLDDESLKNSWIFVWYTDTLYRRLILFVLLSEGIFTFKQTITYPTKQEKVSAKGEGIPPGRIKIKKSSKPTPSLLIYLLFPSISEIPRWHPQQVCVSRFPSLNPLFVGLGPRTLASAKRRWWSCRAILGLPSGKKKHILGGGFNPVEKYLSNWIISPGRSENKKYLKPPGHGDPGRLVVSRGFRCLSKRIW